MDKTVPPSAAMPLWTTIFVAERFIFRGTEEERDASSRAGQNIRMDCSSRSGRFRKRPLLPRYCLDGSIFKVMLEKPASADRRPVNVGTGSIGLAARALRSSARPASCAATSKRFETAHCAAMSERSEACSIGPALLASLSSMFNSHFH